jgi:hypothetical protein
MDKQSIKNEFYNKYGDYSKTYIDEKLKQIGTFAAGESYYSVSGWYVFYAPTQHKLFQEAVKKDLEIAKKKVAFMKAIDSDFLIPDIIESISKQIK